ncbi:MAG: hypothetical protein KID00_13510 [Clostridium argentinense]|uniref:Lipoprotein n=1 Tax=Clostridium faecium TaxID=2762223 RepID=A0ABR8YW19_9CLOT|nr:MULTISPECIES: hypothetical protein [Clostridium]MBD8048440.1 hypothetical protein [Clostridium faecium]MBS5824842.1 hypothetical protein [Clostridium argentinense]MDU1348848.1 hypothetical protein [Clostridium argentinense]
MKKLLSILCILISLAFIGCTKEKSESLTPDDIAKDVIIKYYTFDKNRIDLYGELGIDGVTSAESADKLHSPIKDYFEENLYLITISEKIIISQLKNCHRDKYTLEVKNVDLNKVNSSEEGIYDYEYSGTLIKKSFENNSSEEVSMSGHLKLNNYNDKWTVTSFSSNLPLK